MAGKAKRITAAKSHDEIFGEMVEGLTDAISIARGEASRSSYRIHVPVEVDVKSIRRKTGLSQEAFAGAYGFSTGSVRDWEQHRVMPDQSTRAYLYVIGQKPDLVRKTLVPLTPARAKATSPGPKPSGRPARSQRGQRTHH